MDHYIDKVSGVSDSRGDNLPILIEHGGMLNPDNVVILKKNGIVLLGKSLYEKAEELTKTDKSK